MQTSMITLNMLNLVCSNRFNHTVYYRLLHIIFLGDEAKLIKSEAELLVIFLHTKSVFQGSASRICFKELLQFISAEDDRRRLRRRPLAALLEPTCCQTADEEFKEPSVDKSSIGFSVTLSHHQRVCAGE